MRHRFLMALLVLALGATTGLAQNQPSEEVLKANYDKKLSKEFAGKIEWVQSLETAKTRAAAEGKLIYAYFSRSYAR
ncbi:MAG: hypothetical protein H6807_03815 [Planctomycetes bacterium]|nr:hypothetical protein [Planctomycetota bacterium]